MRIAVIGSGTRSESLPPWLGELASARGGEAVIVNPRLSAFAFTPYERLVVDVGYVDAAQTAAGEPGCSAIVLNSFADYGIEAARAVVAVPVIGAGEATIEAASAAGRRPFAIVTVWPESMGFLYEERLRAVRGGSRCVAIRRISAERELERLGAPDGVMDRMARGESAVLHALLRECEAAIRDDGAAAIALGCTCMAPIGPALAAACRVPVYESSRTAMGAALDAVAARTGSPAPRARNARLVPGLVTGGLAALNTGEDQAPDAGDCEPCNALTFEDAR